MGDGREVDEGGVKADYLSQKFDPKFKDE